MGGKTSAKSKNTWITKAYDRINLTVPKGQKDLIQAHAEAQGESTNGFINRAISKFQLGLSENKNTHFFSANRPDGYCQGDLTIRKN